VSETAGDHKPVMVEEVLSYLRPERGEVIVDGTLGAGGHAEAILERITPGAGSLVLTGTRRQLLARRRGWMRWLRRSVTIAKISEVYAPSLMARA